MQSEPNASSPRIQTQINPLATPNASQYGFLPEQLHSADLHSSLDEEHVESPESSTSPNADDFSSEDTVLHRQLRRLSVNGVESRPKPSFQRISEYENALSSLPAKKQSEGPGFKIIKKKGGNRLDSPQLDKFPNGTVSPESSYGLLVASRAFIPFI